MTPGKFLHHRPHIVACLLALLVLLRPAHVQAQSANDGFDPAVNGTVRAVAVQADGRILVGGQFTSVGGLARTNLARLRPDGSVDTSFNASISDPVFESGTVIESIAVQTDGRILIGGFFTMAGNASHWAIARLHPDGTSDASFSADANGTVFSLVVQADGKILAGGDFTSLGGQPRQHLARLNSDGSIDLSFGAETDNAVFSILLLPDRTIIVGGGFSRISGESRTNLAKLSASGEVDAQFSPNPDAVVLNLARQADGKILMVGSFSHIREFAQSNVGRLHPDGRADTAFQPQVDSTTRAVIIQPDGRILIGGGFNFVEGRLSSGLACLESDGRLDASFHTSLQGSVQSLALQGDGKILVGGYFADSQGPNSNHLARLYADGSVDATLQTPALRDAAISWAGLNALAPQPDGRIIVGGAFTNLGGMPRSYLARIHPDGRVDTSFQPAVNDEVLAVAVQDDGKILVGGFFTRIAGRGVSALARLNPDGSYDTNFSSGGAVAMSGRQSFVSAFVLEPGGGIWFCGNFSFVDGWFRSLVARLHPDGSLDNNVQPNFACDDCDSEDRVAYSMAWQSGKILVTGLFDEYDYEPVSGLVRLHLDGSLDSAFQPVVAGSNYSFTIIPRTLAVQQDDKILIGGYFNRLNGQPRVQLGRLNGDGTLDTDFRADAGGEVDSIALQADGRILAAGFFKIIGGVTRTGVALLGTNGTPDPSFTPALDERGLAALVWGRGVSLQTDGKALLGGVFTGVEGLPRTNLARFAPVTAATQWLELDRDGHRVTWRRGGAAPELVRASFDWSADGVTYAPIGMPLRIRDGWHLDGLALLAGETFYVRARGRVTGGYFNGSSGLIESVAQFWRLPPPFLNNVQVLGGGQFQFSFTNTNAVAFSVLASTNAAAPLAQWESLRAPVPVGGGVYQFTDPGATNHARRFYQLRSP